ncbi:hypothetical protein ABZ543_08380 [Streptomyces roseifaciens]
MSPCKRRRTPLVWVVLTLVCLLAALILLVTALASIEKARSDGNVVDDGCDWFALSVAPMATRGSRPAARPAAPPARPAHPQWKKPTPATSPAPARTKNPHRHRHIDDIDLCD